MADEQATNQAAEDAQADGYYDDDMQSEDLDLSFLDDDEGDERKEQL
jgi:hypothetical protein